MPNKFPSLRLFIFLLLTHSFALAGTTGKLVGTVIEKDTAEPLPGVNIMLAGTNRGAATDANGFYQIINVPPQSYTLVATMIGYAQVQVNDVKVSIDRTTKINIELQVEVLEGQEVVIQAERPAIEIDRTHSASIVSADMVETMPVTSVSEVIELQAGIVKSGGEMHFRGGRGREVAYLIDGIPVSNAYSQSGGNNVAVENAMVQELEVISGTFNAEYGNAQSGVVNIITKRPDDRFSGSIHAYSGDFFSNKNDVFIGINQFNPLAEKDIQANFSGPIIREKLGIHFSGRFNDWQDLHWYERRYQPIDGWRIAAYQKWYQEYFAETADATQGIYIPDSLKTGDVSQGPLRTGNYVTFSTKLSFFPSTTFNVTYQLFGLYSQSQGGGSSRRYQPDETVESKSISQSHFCTFKHFPVENFFYTLSMSYQNNDGDSYYRKDNYVAMYPGDEGIQPFSSYANGFSLGDTPGFYTNQEGKNYRRQLLLKGDANWQLDKYNFLKAGFEIKQHDINTYSWGFKETKDWETRKWPNPNEINGADYTFDEYWNALSDYWATWESVYDTTRYIAYADSEYTLWRDYTIKPREAAFYLQDKVELGEIIINAGMRLDLFDANEMYPIESRTESENLGNDSNLQKAEIKYQLSPRLGISFPISSSGAFHASYGHFFQMPSFQYMYNEPLYSMTRIQLEGRRLGNTNLDPEKTVTYEIGLQQAISPTISVDITAYYKDFRNLLGIERVTTIDAVGYERYINRDYGNTKGITLSMTKTSGFLTGGVNYTYAFANGSSSDPNSLYLIQTATRYGGQDVQFAERKILSLDWDQRHTLNMILNIGKSNDWSAGIIGFLYSGTPYSPSFVERFDIAAREYRNSGEKPMRWTIDFKFKKHFSLGAYQTALFFKIDNLFDHLNQEYVYSSTGRTDQNARLPENEALEVEKLQQEGHFTLQEVDNQPTWYSNPRKIEFGVHVSF